MIDGALVLPPTRVGMMEASTTRSPSTPITHNSGSTTAPSSVPHPGCPDRMVDGIGTVAQNHTNFVVGSDVLAIHFGNSPFRKRLRVHNPAGHLEAPDHHFEIICLIVELRIDARRRRWIRAIQHH
jgi:hypothetical protein